MQTVLQLELTIRNKDSKSRVLNTYFWRISGLQVNGLSLQGFCFNVAFETSVMCNTFSSKEKY